MKNTFLGAFIGAIFGLVAMAMLWLVASSWSFAAPLITSKAMIIFFAGLFVAAMVFCLVKRSIPMIVVSILLIGLFFIAVAIVNYGLTKLFTFMGAKNYIWVGYAIFIIAFLGWIYSFRKHLIFVGTNEALIVQGFVNGFFTSADRSDKLGSVFFYYPKFIYKSVIRLDLSTQVIPLRRIDERDESVVDVAVTTKDGMLVTVVGSFEFQITRIMLFYNRISSGNWDKTLTKASDLFSRIIETYIEKVVSCSYDLEKMDECKKEISRKSIEEIQKTEAKDELLRYGVEIVRLHITDFGGSDIVAFRENEAAIQDQENKLALSEQEKKTQLGILENKKIVLDKEQEVVVSERAFKEATAEMEKALQLIKARGLAEALQIDLEAKKQFEEIFKYTNSVEAIVNAIKADASRYPQLTSLVGGTDGFEKMVSMFKAFQQALNQ